MQFFLHSPVLFLHGQQSSFIFCVVTRPLSLYCNIQGGKTFCASFCASLIAGSRRAFLCVCWVCSTVFVCCWEKFWLRLNKICTRCERFLLEKPFYFCVVFVFRHLQIILDSNNRCWGKNESSPSVWGGIKSFQHFQRGEYFSDCAFDLLVNWFRLLLPGWIKTRLYSVISKYFFTYPDLFPLQNHSFILLFSQRIICAP